MKAIILNNSSFILTEGEAPYFIRKEDFLNFLTDKEALREFVRQVPINSRAISPVSSDSILENKLDVELENNYERLGFYERYDT